MHQAREAAKTTGPSFRHDTPFFGASPAPVFFQPKLTVNEPGDPYEREADEVADKVMRMEDVTVQHCATCDDEAVQRKCPECEKEEAIMPSAETNANVIPAGIEAQLHQSRGRGRSMDTGTQTFMEQRFGASFQGVNIHTDGTSADMNRQLRAKAFAVGSDIYFNQQQYQPQSAAGRHLLAHELTHVLQQRNGLQRISRKDYNVGTTASPVNVLIDYSFLETTYFGRFGQGCEDLFARFTGQPVGPVQAAIAALSNTHQRWLLFALDLLIDNPVPGLDKTAAASALIAYAPSARYTPLGGRTDTVFEDEVFRSSGWFERSLTRGLTAPTATEASALDVLYNGAAASGGSSSACPAARTPLDEPALRNGVRPAFTAFVASQLAILSGATVGTQSISDIRPIADLVQEEAREFFHPYFGRSSTRAFLDQWTYSARIQASTAAGAIPAGMRRAFIDNRAMLKATEAGVIGATHFDSRCAGDIAVWDDIINILDADPTIQADVSRLLSWQSFTEHDNAHAEVTMNLQFIDRGNSGDACSARWRSVRTLCHELMHAYNAQTFFNANHGRQIIREGFAEVLGVQLFNSIRAKAANNSYRRRFEGGLPAGDCIGVSIPVAAPGYQDAGANAASVLSTVGNDRFRAAFFLGQTGLVSLQPCLEQGREDNVYEREAAAKATEVSGFSDAVSA